jgi:hypothetical protein
MKPNGQMIHFHQGGGSTPKTAPFSVCRFFYTTRIRSLSSSRINGRMLKTFRSPSSIGSKSKSRKLRESQSRIRDLLLRLRLFRLRAASKTIRRNSLFQESRKYAEYSKMPPAGCRIASLGATNFNQANRFCTAYW